MAQYINKDDLVAEIEKEWRNLANKNAKANGKYDIAIYTLLSIKSLIDTLEVKKVDLDFTKEVDMWISNNGDTNGFFNVQELAKHFFELGLKTKGE